MKKLALLLLIIALASPVSFAKGGRSYGTHSSRSTKATTHTHRTKTVSNVKRDKRGHIKRSAAAKHAFIKSNPCPSTGKTSGRCPGYVIDHVKPLASGGADDPSNMQWQTVAAAKEKDKWERK